MIFAITVFIHRWNDWKEYSLFCSSRNLETGYKNKLEYCFVSVHLALKERHRKFKTLSFKEFYNYYGLRGVL